MTSCTWPIPSIISAANSPPGTSASPFSPTETKAPDGWICLAFSNHDVVRHVSRWATHGQEAAFTRLAATLILAMRGSVCLYQGEELGLKEAELAFERSGRSLWHRILARVQGPRRLPHADGLADPCPQRRLLHRRTHLAAGPRRPPDPRRRYPGRRRRLGAQFYRAMLTFRRAHPALAKGSITLLDAPDNVLAFIREHDGQRLLCVFNMSANPRNSSSLRHGPPRPRLPRRQRRPHGWRNRSGAVRELYRLDLGSSGRHKPPLNPPLKGEGIRWWLSVTAASPILDIVPSPLRGGLGWGLLAQEWSPLTPPPAAAPPPNLASTYAAAAQKSRPACPLRQSAPLPSPAPGQQSPAPCRGHG